MRRGSFVRCLCEELTVPVERGENQNLSPLSPMAFHSAHSRFVRGRNGVKMNSERMPTPLLGPHFFVSLLVCWFVEFIFSFGAFVDWSD